MYARTESFTEQVLRDHRWPEQANSWPQSRRLEDYVRLLLAPWTFKSLSETSKLPDIMALLSLAWMADKPTPILDPVDFLQRINPENKPIVVDIGMGDAFALREMKEKAGFVTIGLGLHEINPDNAHFIDLLAYSPVPNGPVAQRIFNYLRGKVALVCEAFGASTYAAGETNPIEALIFEGLLLAPGGVAKLIVSSIPKEEEEQSPLGFASQRQQLVNFFKDQLGLELLISRTYIKSLVMPGSYCVDFHVEIKRNPEAVVSDKSLEELFTLAKKHIGQCKVIPKSTDVGEFGGFGIRGRTYTREGETIQWKGQDYAQGVQAKSFAFVGEGNTCPSFTLHFNSNELMGDFATRFAEYYLNNKAQSEWSMKVNEQNNHVVLTYKDMQHNRIHAKAQAKNELNQVFPGLWSEFSAHRLFQPQAKEFVKNSAVCNVSTTLNCNS
ncbi:hypothetical protein [Legionella drancourtii]|uniref:Uncharacterized protein n=1 Tax=Legionella drancourtii LLAP12 TaxID=658187 RepID=G9EQM3_9GAMM|nr:hypothetical protein [Legionella drancourtii]EHL30469.1 hypothetical protein LDG_7571 [Legionella drancourtii LLAP12]